MYKKNRKNRNKNCKSFRMTSGNFIHTKDANKFSVE